MDDDLVRFLTDPHLSEIALRVLCGKDGDPVVSMAELVNYGPPGDGVELAGADVSLWEFLPVVGIPFEQDVPYYIRHIYNLTIAPSLNYWTHIAFNILGRFESQSHSSPSYLRSLALISSGLI